MAMGRMLALRVVAGVPTEASANLQFRSWLNENLRVASSAVNDPVPADRHFVFVEGQCRSMARLRHVDCIKQCPSSRAKRETYARTEFFAFCLVRLRHPFDPGGVHKSAAASCDFAVSGNLIFFSFVTLTTTGYGDIVPVHPFARSLANVEAIIGQIYPATLLARLVTLELAHERGS
jgi:hypothetical protein